MGRVMRLFVLIAAVAAAQAVSAAEGADAGLVNQLSARVPPGLECAILPVLVRNRQIA